MWQTLVLAGIGGRTVAQARASMSRAEFCDWVDRYEDRPFDDRYRFHRPAAWIAMHLTGAEPKGSLQWLTHGKSPAQSDAPPLDGQWSEADRNTFAAFGSSVVIAPRK